MEEYNVVLNFGGGIPAKVENIPLFVFNYLKTIKRNKVIFLSKTLLETPVIFVK